VRDTALAGAQIFRTEVGRQRGVAAYYRELRLQPGPRRDHRDAKLTRSVRERGSGGRVDLVSQGTSRTGGSGDDEEQLAFGQSQERVREQLDRGSGVQVKDRSVREEDLGAPALCRQPIAGDERQSVGSIE
jgi:hypothetical protein